MLNIVVHLFGFATLIMHDDSLKRSVLVGTFNFNLNTKFISLREVFLRS